MRTIVFASQKGGSGKTTLAAHVAVAAELARRGPVALGDTDPQGSLSTWWNRRQAPTPVFAGLLVRELRAQLATLATDGAALCIIDTPPAVTTINRDVIAAADLVVIPTRASPHDLDALASTIEICRAADVPFAFVVNGAKPAATITHQALEILRQHGPVAPQIVADRVAYAAAMVDGRTAPELAPHGKAAAEIASLTRFVLSRFNPARKGKTAKE